MDLNILKPHLEQLLAIINANSQDFSISNFEIEITSNWQYLASELNKVQVAVDPVVHTLNFQQFILSNIRLKADFDQFATAGWAADDFIVLDFPGNAVAHLEGRSYDFSNAPNSLVMHVDNKLNYLELYDLLKSNVFSDHHNSADKEIILYNSAKGILKIEYVLPVPDFQNDIKQNVNQIIKALNDIQLKKYFQNSLYDLAIGNIVKLVDIVNNYDRIIFAAKRDYELAIKQFDFLKFRDSLYVEKDKFFNATRDVISKVYAQVIGIPISISASVYAAYKTDRDIFVLTVILASFTIYVAIYLGIQYTYFSDLKEIEEDFKRDFEIVSKQSGLSSDVIAPEYKKISNKIKRAKIITLGLLFAVLALGFCVFCVILNQILKS